MRYLPPDTRPSAQTVIDAQRNEAEAFELLSIRACTLALRTASALVRDEEEARDIAQDVAVEVLRGLNRLRDPLAFDGWVHRISVRRIQRVIRKRSLLRTREQPLLDEIDWSPTLREDDKTELVATRSALSAALAELPVRQRLAVVLRYVHDLSDEEIAAALNCRIGSVHSLLSRARSTLRGSDHLVSLSPLHQGGPN